MGGQSRICEICGARESKKPGFFASFPIDESRCRTWIQIVGKVDLVHVPIEKLNELRHICGDHFEKRDFNKKGNRLKRKAFPKLNLSAPPLSDHELRQFPLHVASKSGPIWCHPEKLAAVQLTPVEPSSSRDQLATTSIQELKAPSRLSMIPPMSKLEETRSFLQMLSA